MRMTNITVRVLCHSLFTWMHRWRFCRIRQYVKVICKVQLFNPRHAWHSHVKNVSNSIKYCEFQSADLLAQHIWLGCWVNIYPAWLRIIFSVVIWCIPVSVKVGILTFVNWMLKIQCLKFLWYIQLYIPANGDCVHVCIICKYKAAGNVMIFIAGCVILPLTRYVNCGLRTLRECRERFRSQRL